MSEFYLAAAAVTLLLIVISALALYQKKLNPGEFLLLPAPVFGSLAEFIHIPFTMPNHLIWTKKFEIFEKHNSSVVTFRNVFWTSVLVGDAAATAELFNNKAAWGKPPFFYKMLEFLGPTVLTAELGDYRNHRRLLSPIFLEGNNQLVWLEATHFIDSWFLKEKSNLKSTSDSSGQQLLEEDFLSVSLKLFMLVVSSTTFGRKYDWDFASVDVPEKGSTFKFGFMTALNQSLNGIFVKLLLPNWAYRLPIKSFRQVGDSFSDLQDQLEKRIDHKKAENVTGLKGTDIFSEIIQQNLDKKTNEELGNANMIIANMITVLLGGRETAAHSLTFLLNLLAIYPEHQEKIYAEIVAAGAAVGVTNGKLPYSAYSELPYVQATFNETLRLYAPIQTLHKQALVDTILPAHDMSGNPIQIKVKTGWRATVAGSGLHYNPHYWKNPGEFMPSRFIDSPDGSYKWNRDAFSAWSGGIRGCVGKKFAMVETVAVVTEICRNYEILVPENLQESYKRTQGENEIERRERILNPKPIVLLTPGKLSLIFKKRSA